MPEGSFPDRPSLRRLKREARSLHRAIRSGDPAALADFEKFHPEAIDPGEAKLADAYLVLARSYGFSSWPRLLLACEKPRRRRRTGIIKSAELEVAVGADTWYAISAAAEGDTASLRELLGSNPKLARGEFWYTTTIHFAVREGHADAVQLLLESGADPEWNGLHQGSLIDMARDRGHTLVAELLEHARDRRGRVAAQPAEQPVHVAARTGDLVTARQLLDSDPQLVELGDAAGATPLHNACRRCNAEMVKLLLERGADPTWEEPTAPRGRSLHSAASAGNLAMVELLLAHGADPNGTVNSCGSATYIARTPEIRALLLAHGGTLDPYLAWIGDDDQLVRRLANDPDEAFLAEALTTLCTLGKRDTLGRLLHTGIRLPSVVTGCQSYLLEHADMLRMLLAHGMSPDLMNWQQQTLLHLCCQRPDSTGAAVERASILLDAGADIVARDEEYRSTPLAWAARTNAVAMAEFLIARGAPMDLPDDEPWATPLAWADRRGNTGVAVILRRHGATR